MSLAGLCPCAFRNQIRDAASTDERPNCHDRCFMCVASGDTRRAAEGGVNRVSKGEELMGKNRKENADA